MTPIILDHVAEPIVHEQVLVNLCQASAPGFSRFERVIEIVGLDEDDRALARNRFRFYRERGYEIRTHDLSQAASRPWPRSAAARATTRNRTTCSASSTS